MPRMLACERLDTTDSTQREALQRLNGLALPSGGGRKDGLDVGPEPFALWTTRQTRGVGSHGRRWQDSPDGGLAVSMAWPQDRQAGVLAAWPARLSLLALLTLERCYPELVKRLGLKWPNDIMCGDAKLAGVLVSRHQVAARWWLIAGFGINLLWKDRPDVGREVTDLQALGVGRVDPQALVQALCDDMEKFWRGDIVGDHWEQQFMARDVMAGQMVNVVHPVGGEVLHRGENAGVSSAGELLLRQSTQMIPISIGELSLRKMAK